MLGVIFTGGAGPPPPLVRKLLEGEPADKVFFIAADSGLVLAQACGISPACIVGDMDSVPNELLESFPKEALIRHKTDKDYTDTELAMQIVIEKGCKEIWIIGGGGGRIDHLFAIKALFEREIFPSRWITDYNDIYCIDCGGARNKNILSKKLEKNTPVSVFPLGDGGWQAESIGLKWPLSGLSWNRGFFGLSNEAEDLSFTVTAVKGRFMIVLGGVNGGINFSNNN